MRNVTLSPLARRDIKGIWRYTRNKWGEVQASKYTLEIGRIINSLSTNPNKGAAIEHIREGYRKHLVGKHLIIYRVTDTTVGVIRVLKQDMDIVRHLS